ncbi:hypothetical protein FPV67DRAFT_1511581 [Lyophyllum atratum]|nr:hypothetical protein FPV67DRAFT_1511581 [Lyophyllum atratum]
MSGFSSSNPPAAPASDSSPPLAAPSAISAAIARFRPTPKEVISGIAPHVFDERRTRRRRSHSPRPASYHSQHSGAGAKSSSPLRFSAVITVDNEGSLIFLDQTEHCHHHHHHHASETPRDVRTSKDQCAPVQDTSQPIIEISGKIDKTRQHGFRIDSIRILKTIAVKLKHSTRA